ncbi:MAG: ArgE/DapE family deacylase [Armatimonadetes bacterium]|nr:ArgE/DapE family deacylase [Armatimonadota bacterium]
MDAKISSLIDQWSNNATSLLANLISFRSTVGNEGEVQRFLADYICELGFEPRLVPIHPGIEMDPDYTLVPNHKGYEGRANLVFTLPGNGKGKSIILNTHVDVVPGPDELFSPRVENGVIYGRGAVDAKGHVATIIQALVALRDAGVRLSGDVMVQFVIEEEAGGNGALSVILDGMRADGVVVMESTDFGVRPAGRGAVWFKLAIEGRSTHMGRWRDGVNAIEKMMDAIRVLQKYEQKLVAESGGDPLFPDTEANVKVNIGTIQGGEWPSMVAGNCVIEGGVGFLPNKRLADIKAEVKAALEAGVDDWTRNHYTLEFTRLHNEAYRMPPDHPLAQELYKSAISLGAKSDVTGMTASCDARLFWHRGGMPTVVFGPGKFPYAHALDEQITIDEIALGAKILADFLIRWCGT